MSEAYKEAYKCGACGCIHGWITHPHVARVDDATMARYADCTLWKCPGCGVVLDSRTNERGLFRSYGVPHEVIPDIDAYLQERERRFVHDRYGYDIQF